MPKSKQLTRSEQQFFELLAKIIFSNPFGLERVQVEEMLGHTGESQPTPGEHHYAAVIPVLEQHLSTLAARGIRRRDDVRSEDRALLEYAFLFQQYHRFVAQFDELIQRQLAQGDTPASVPFAQELIQELARCGFAENEALRYVALFYQFRRAYFFIAHALVGDSSSMKQLRGALWNSVFTSDVRLYAGFLWDRMEDFSTLLLGETGTGKGSAAAAVGRSGLIPFDPATKRFKHSFMATFTAINLSEFPETLIESELFGHRKGAFTGAIENHRGVFERCSAHGALFLDEIGDVSVPTQIKLLTVLQERSFTPVGSHQPLRFEGRVIAATNRSVETLLAEGRFRQDFYYRLTSDVIQVPPLRVRLQESAAELEQLINLLVARMTGQNNEVLSEQVRDGLSRSLPADYSWPGNVRELEQAIRRILIHGRYEPPTVGRPTRSSWLAQAENGELNAGDLVSAYCRMLHDRFGTYEEVASRTGLDRRTVKKYVTVTRTKAQ